MKSERFADLLGRYNAGEIDPSHPDYDEFKQGILEREKAQQENTEMRMKLEQMGLTKRKAEQEFQMNSVMRSLRPDALYVSARFAFRVPQQSNSLPFRPKWI